MDGIGSNNVSIPEAEKGIKKLLLYCLITLCFVYRNFNDVSYNKKKIRLQISCFVSCYKDKEREIDF